MPDFGALSVFHSQIIEARTALALGIQNDRHNTSDYIDSSLDLLLSHLFDIAKYALYVEREKVPEQTLLPHLKQEYPVLMEQVERSCQQWVENQTELWFRWLVDAKKVAQQLFTADMIGFPIALSDSLADRHNHGRTTQIVTLSCGRKLVYKPRDMRLESSFYDFARQLGFDALYKPTYVLSESYGWMEFVSTESCISEKQVRGFYVEAGMLLSLMYALEAEDIHAENLIAHGQHPVIVDLEMLFHRNADSVDVEDVDMSQMRPAIHNVLKSFLLPVSPETNRKESIAAITTLTPQETDYALHNIPKLDGTYVPVTEYIKPFVSGFKDGYKKILLYKKEGLNKFEALSAFSGCTARYVCRKTVSYQRVIKALYHPDIQSGRRKPDFIFAHMLKACTPKMMKRVEVECRSMLQGDVPRFTHQVEQKQLVLDGRVVSSDYFDFSAMDEVVSHMNGLNQHDLEQQIKIIHQAFEPEKIALVSEEDDSTLNNLPLNTIMTIFEREYVGFKHLGFWPVYRRDAYFGSRLSYSHQSLYDGQSGILLFMAHAMSYYQHTFSPFLSEGQIVNSLCAIRGWVKYSTDSIGMNGLSGILYANAAVLKLYPLNSSVVQNAQTIIDEISVTAEHCQELDVIDGLAGAILVLLSTHQLIPQSNAQDVAKKCTDRLVSLLSESHSGGWPTYKNKTLFGFAHGLSGIGHALLKYASIADDARAYTKALELLSFESEQFDEATGNWPDRRFEGDKQKEEAMTAWCHGAVGIGISRLSSLRYLKDPTPRFFEVDIQRSKQHIEDKGSVRGHGLCHGNMGNSELMKGLYKAGYITEQKWLSFVENTKFYVTGLLSERKATHSQNNVFTLSLMNGWAGIGFQLMRLEKDELPNLLMLEI